MEYKYSKPKFVGTEADAAKRARERQLTLIQIAKGRTGGMALEEAGKRGYRPNELWIIDFGYQWVAFEAITKAEEQRRLNGMKPKRRKEIASKPIAQPETVKVKAAPRNKWMGLTACSLIRYLAHNRVSLEGCVKLLPKLGISGINAATFKIQHRQGRKGEGIPKLDSNQCKALNIAKKGL